MQRRRNCHKVTDTMLVNSPRLHHHTFPLLHYFIAIILVPCNRSALFLWFSINIAQKTDIQMRLFVEQPCKVEAASLSSTFSELEWNWLIKSLLLKTLLWFRVYYRQRFVPCCWFFFWLIWRSMYSATVWIKALQLGQLHDGEMKSAGSRCHWYREMKSAGSRCHWYKVVAILFTWTVSL